MSLLDSLLLDPHRFNVWVAARTDGIKGSGTISDPYDGSTAAKFDTFMNSFAEFTCVNLGPGLFLTQGYADGISGGWQVKRGMRIVGSGIEVTKLQLSAGLQNAHYFAVGHALAESGNAGVQADFFEISDLTIDCNLANATGPNVACGAVRIKGNHCRIRRIKANGWGTRTSSKPCFVIATITMDDAAANPSIADTVIEDCMAIDRTTDSGAVGPVIALYAGSRRLTEVFPEPAGESAVIRNCFVDGSNPAIDLGLDIRAISVNSCHEAIVEGNQIYNVKHGGPYEGALSVPEAIVRNNFYKNVIKGTFLDLGRLGPSATVTTFSVSAPTVTATTSATHLLKVGDRMKITGLNASPAFYEVTDVPSGTTFKFTGSGNGTSGSVEKVLGVDKLLVEGNTIELALSTTGETPVGIHVTDQSLISSGPPFPNGQVILRDNRIRYVDGMPPETGSYTGYAIEVHGATALIARNNVVDVTPPNPIKNYRCGAVSYFNNSTPAGILIQGFNEDTDKKYDELETEAEDALVLALFNER